MKLPKRFIILLLTIPFLFGILFVMYFTDYRPKSNIFMPWQEQTAPTLKLRAVPRYPEGLRLYIDTDNFTMSHVMTKIEAKKSHGHVHLYINNKLHSMVSERSVDISLNELSEKDNEILVTLQAADHRFVTMNGNPVFDRIWVNKEGQEYQYQGKKTEDGHLPEMIQKSINNY